MTGVFRRWWRQPPPVQRFAPSIPTVYTLTAEQGSIATTGQVAALLKASLVAAEQGSYALTGQDVIFTKGVLMVAASGSFALTGQDAGLTAGRVVTADFGAYDLNGLDNELNRNIPMAADFGSFATTGQVAQRGYILQAEGGNYSANGVSAVLLPVRFVTAAQGSIALNGQAAGGSKSQGVLQAEGAVFNVTGNPATLTAKQFFRRGRIASDNNRVAARITDATVAEGKITSDDTVRSGELIEA